MITEENNFIRIEVGGKDEILWINLRSTLIQAIKHLLDSVNGDFRDDTKTSIIKSRASRFLDYSSKRNKHPELENSKTLAEIELLYSEREEKFAKVERINAETESIKLRTSIEKLIIALVSYKVLLSKESKQEEIFFLKEIEDFIAMLREMKRNLNIGSE